MTTKRRLANIVAFATLFAIATWAMTHVIDLAYNLYFIFTH
jgi:hypothetical protein